MGNLSSIFQFEIMYKVKKHKVLDAREEVKKNQVKSFFESKLKGLFTCDCCDKVISIAESKRNCGLCDDCVANNTYSE